MKNKHFTFIGLIFLVVITSITTLILSGFSNFLFTGSIYGFTNEEMEFISKLMASKKILSENFYGEISDKMIYDGAMSGMLEALDDPYTSYLDDEENQELLEIAEGEYEGIGVVISGNVEKGSDITVIGIIKDSPAEKAELKLLDKIVSVDGVMCKDLTLEEVSQKMKVQAGTELNLVIDRDGKNISKVVKTEAIVLKSVYSENMDGIGYIQIASFDEHTGEEFSTEYNKLREENIKGLIVDVRDNGGGIYDEVIKIAKILVPEGLIVYTEDKDGKKVEERSYGKGIDIPLVLLVNEESASASEVLAGAVKDRDCGTLIGKKTFGKGVVQGWYMIGDGTSIKLTIAKYFTPSGVCIEGIGIEPDIEVENTSYTKDLQLDKAIEFLNDKIKD